MKMRFDIEVSVKKNVKDEGRYHANFVHMDSSLLFKYISYVVIDGKKYDKPKSDSREIQNYYYFIVRNKMKVTEIMMKNGKHCFLKEGKYHSYDRYCLYDPVFSMKHYAIDGVVLPPDEARRFVLKRKLDKLINQSK
jgi:hypothetical protein